MKKIIVTCLLVLAAVFSLNAQSGNDTSDTSKYWTMSGNTGINVSQTSFSNWTSGGDSAVSLDFFYNYSADYKRNKNLWTNRLELAYGLNDTKSTGLRKTNDKIYLSSNYGYEIAGDLYAAAMMTFNTQFAKGFDYATSTSEYISKFMSPGYLTVGLGIIWTPKQWFTLSFSPTAYRATFVTDRMLSDAGSFGVDPGKRIRHEFGAQLKGEVNYEIMNNVTLYSRLELFSNYLEKPQNVDVSWDLQLNMKVNKWVSANFTMNMIYDDDMRISGQGARLQVREALGVGIQVNF